MTTTIRPYVFDSLAPWVDARPGGPNHTWERFGPPVLCTEEDKPHLERYGADVETLCPTFAVRTCRYAIKVDAPGLAQPTDVTLQVSNLGLDRYLLLLRPDVVAAESYGAAYAAERIAELLGERVEVQTPRGPVGINLREVPVSSPITVVRGVMAASMWCTNYAHWLLEGLPRLRYRELVNDPDKWGPIVLPDAQPAYVAETLDRAFLDTVVQMRVQPGESYRFQSLVVPSFIAPGGYSREQIRWLRDSLGHCSDVPTGRKIYISRSDAQARRVVNERELAGMLEARGFEIHSLGGRTVEDQVRLFSAASVIVAPHGAGLVNQVFAPPGTRVLELVPRSWRHPMYWMLAGLAGHRYARIPCPDTGPGQDMVVNPATAGTMLDKLEALT